MITSKARDLIGIAIIIALTGCGDSQDKGSSATSLMQLQISGEEPLTSRQVPRTSDIPLTAAKVWVNDPLTPHIMHKQGAAEYEAMVDNAAFDYSVSGLVYHWRSQISLSGVEILSDQNTPSVNTTAEGSFSLQLMANTISRLTAQRAPSEPEVKQAITSADALAALKIAVGINPNSDPDGSGPMPALPVSPYQLMAADINSDGRVTSGDALGILKIAVGLSSAPSARWVFVDDTTDLWITYTEKMSVYTGSTGAQVDTTNRSKIDFASILVGDVNGSWIIDSNTSVPDIALFQQKSDATGAPMYLWGLRDARDKMPPEITLVGAENIVVMQGSNFSDPGFSVPSANGEYLSLETTGTIGAFPGVYTLTYRATDLSGNSASTSRTVELIAPERASIRLEAEDFDAYADNTAENEGQAYRLNDAVDIELSNDSDGTYNVGWTDTGEWLEYIISVPVDNHYSLSSRVAAPESGGFFSVSVDGVTLAHQSIIGTGDWQAWSTQTEYLGLLEAGEHRLRINIQRGLFNLNWLLLEPLNFDKIPTPEEAPTANALASMMGLGVNIGQVFESIGANPPEFDPVRAKIDAYYALGFRTFRLPVTWTAAIEGRALVLDSNVGQIDPTHPRLATIQALVDYALSLGDTVVILNAHHEASIKDNQAAAVLERLWSDIASLFQDRSHRLIYELLNEPHDSNGGAMPAAILRDMSSRAYAQIRASDPKRTIVISGNQWGGAWELNATWPSLAGVGDGLDPYLMATFHHYDPWTEFHSEDATNRAYPFTDDTLRNPMRTADQWRQQLGFDIPIFIGEWGVGWGKKQSSMDCNNIRLWYQSFNAAAQEFGMPTQVWDDGGWFEIFNYGSGAFSNNLAECITGTCDWEGVERFNQACYP